METTLLLALQIVILDICLSGDNAVIIGAAAAGLNPKLRDRAIFVGMALALLLRIVFTALTGKLMLVSWIGLVAGVLLLWVAFKAARDILAQGDDDAIAAGKKTFLLSIVAIVVADVTMSLDNVMAIAALAKSNFAAMAFGLLLSITIMGFGAKLVAALMERWKWVNFVGIALIVWIASKMIYDSAPSVYHALAT